jgi:Mg2+ and Co2+ transporter CorA
MSILEEKDRMIERMKARIEALEKEVDAVKAERLTCYEKLAAAERVIGNLRTDMLDSRRMMAAKETGKT